MHTCHTKHNQIPAKRFKTEGCDNPVCDSCTICWECYDGPGATEGRKGKCECWNLLQEHRKKETKTTMVTLKKEDAEIAYSDKVSFSVEGAKYIEIEDCDTAIAWLQNRKAEREKIISLTHNIEGAYPSDAMLAMMRVFKSEYGFVSFSGMPGFFGPKPPLMLSIPTGLDTPPGEAPWGEFEVPGIEGKLATGIIMDKHQRPIFQLRAKIKSKCKGRFQEIAELIKKDLLVNSIYKGKAIKVEFPDFNEVEFDPTVHLPQFFDVRTADLEKLVFNPGVMSQIKNSVVTPIVHWERVKRESKLKRGALFAGLPGTGKTELARAVAKLCEQNGWTFIYLAKSADFAQSVGFAKMYQRAVIFAEDLDSIVCAEEADEQRDAATQQVLNTLDGVDTKDSELLVIFTTNYPNKVSKVMLRPGRLDCVAYIEPPNALSVRRLIQIYARGMLVDGVNLSPICDRLTGQIPAVIREVVERAKLAAIPRLDPDEPMQLSEQDLLEAADSMIEHISMLNKPRTIEPSDLEKAGVAISSLLLEGLRHVAIRGKNESQTILTGLTPKLLEAASALDAEKPKA